MSTDIVHPFDGKRQEADRFNAQLDRYFSKWYIIESVPLTTDKIGIDRLWTDRESHVRYSVEYKDDSRAAETGNAFVETVSIDRQNKPGWAYTCAAQLMVYYVPGWHKAWLISTMAIKNKIGEWTKCYPKVKAKNKDYNTEGVKVPFPEFKKVTYDEHDIPDDKEE